MSPQTLVVLLVGTFLGALRGPSAVGLYLLAGALGAPVFAGGAAGAAHLVGPTAGYLLGFVLAAGWIGWVARGRVPSFSAASAAMVAGHAMILGAGWVRLSLISGPGVAWTQGVAPFLLGGAAKSVLGGAAWWFWARRPRSASGGSGAAGAP